MQSWDLPQIELSGGTRTPVVLFSRDESRAVLIGLDPGQELGDHQVKEAALLVVLEGSVVVDAASSSVEAGTGTLVTFDPNERRTVSSPSGARVLLVLSPWPGEGHYLDGERERER